MVSPLNSAAHPRRTHLFLDYAIIAYAISWAIEIPLALKAQGIISVDIPFAMHYFAAGGPLIAAILLTWRENGSPGLKNLLERTLRWRVEPIWWLVALSPILILLLVTLFASYVRGTSPDFQFLNHFDFLPDIGIAAVLIWLASYGFGEEIGWRGYLLPRLQRDRSAWSASLVLWAIWATWHAPSFFYLHTASSIGMIIGFLIGVLAGSIFLTWLYNSSGGSILIVAVWHGLFDYVTACTECKAGLVAAIISTVVMIWAVVVVIAYKRPNLSLKERQMM
jgi:membrane protease YdiL (CAAX protease family)